MTAFAHWTAMHAWWIARRTEKESIGKPWAAKSSAPGPLGNPVERKARAESTNSAPAQPATRNAEDEAETAKWEAEKAEPAKATVDTIFAPNDPGWTDATPPPRKRAPVQRSKRPLPDEGGPVTDADVETMKKAYAALPAKASAWATRVMVQGNDAPLPWNKLSVSKTVRRYELYRGVRQVAAYAFADNCDCDSNADEVVRAIVHAVTLDDAALFPTVPPGMVLASLSYLEAIKFSEVASDLAQNRYSLLADSTGVLRLAPVD
jgi:hypothetical protein